MPLTCSICQIPLPDNAKFCSECGTQVTVSEEKPAPRFSNVIYTILVNFGQFIVREVNRILFYCSVAVKQGKVMRQITRQNTSKFKALFWLTLLVGVILGFVILVLAGYASNWWWTGFRTYHLWDWLTLLAFPVVLAYVSIWFFVVQNKVRQNLDEKHKKEEQQWLSKRWAILIIVVLVGFIVSLIGGYKYNWEWTGFSGQTLENWGQLLVIPFVLPLLVAVWCTNHPNKLEKSGA